MINFFTVIVYGVIVFWQSVCHSSLNVCEFPGWTISKDELFFYQRIEAIDALDCVERCIETADDCRATVFLVLEDHQDDVEEKKLRNYCQFYSSNSDESLRTIRSRPAPLQIRAGARATLPVDATLFELLERCPADANGSEDDGTLTIVLSAAARQRLDALTTRRQGTVIELQNSDNKLLPFKRLRDRAPSSDAISSGLRDYYASAARQRGDEYYGEAKGLSSSLSPIRPVSISHGGLGSVQYGAVPRSDAAASVPCSALQPGDPCAPPHRPPARWSEWTPDGPCSVSCGRGIRRLRRYCSLAKECEGNSQKEEPCEMPACNQWAPWSEWSHCSVTCGSGGQRQRQRRCRFGDSCEGPATDAQSCNADHACPRWAAWTAWSSACSVTCGTGFRQRERECLPKGQQCPQDSPATDRQPCEARPCPTWGTWSEWGTCSSTCGGGETVRHRECLHDDAHGRGCTGPAREGQSCNAYTCPVWGDWMGWSTCTKTCGEDATRFRTRQCHFLGRPSEDCAGLSRDEEPCRLPRCSQWAEWGAWSACSVTCGQGQQLRTRRCDSGSPRDCVGGDREIRFCQPASCPYFDEWSEWGGCSVTCGRGYCERTRRCRQGELLPEHLEYIQPGKGQRGAIDSFSSTDNNQGHRKLFLRENDEINSSPHQHSSSSRGHALRVAQSVSTHTIDTGTFLRDSPLRDVALSCIGPTTERKACDAGPCCSWTTWSGWGECSAQCGEGSRIRTRRCELELGSGRSFWQPLAAPYSDSAIGSYPLNRPYSHNLNYAISGARAPHFVAHDPPPSSYAASPFNGVCDCVGAPTDAQPCAAPAHFVDACRVAPAPSSTSTPSKVQSRLHANFDTVESAREIKRDANKLLPHEADSAHLVSEEYDTSNRDKLSLTNCSWSEWREWSECDAITKLKTRFRACKGSSNYCECNGASTEERYCVREGTHGVGHVTRLKIVPKHRARDEENDSSKPTATSDTRNNRNDKLDTSEVSYRRRLQDQSTSGGHESVIQIASDLQGENTLEENAKATTDACAWQGWSVWTACAPISPHNAACTEGSGERIRTRFCGCSICENGGITQETESCTPAECT